MKTCPYCAEEIQDAAIVCRYCNHDLSPKLDVILISCGPKKIEVIKALRTRFDIGLVEAKEMSEKTTILATAVDQKVANQIDEQFASLGAQVVIHPTGSARPFTSPNLSTAAPLKNKPNVASTNNMTCLNRVGAGLFITAVLLIIYYFMSNSGSRSGSETQAPDTSSKIDAWVMCQQFVEDRLKAPASADFPTYNPSQVTANGPEEYIVAAYVDAQNSFGASIRTDFTCRVKYTGNDRWQALAINLQE